MLKNTRSYKIWLVLLFTASLCSAVFGAIALGYEFDFTIGQFDKNSPLLLFAIVLALFAGIGSILYPLVRFRGEKLSAAYKISPLNDFASLFAFSALALSFFYELFTIGLTGGTLHKVKLFLTVPAAVFFFALFLLRKSGSGILTVLGGIATVWATFSAFYAYFNPSFTMTSPHRTFPQVALLTLMLLLLLETGISLDRGSFHFALCASVLCGTLSISIGGAYLLAYLFAFNRTAILPTDALVLIAAGIYGFVRAICLFPAQHKISLNKESSSL